MKNKIMLAGVMICLVCGLAVNAFALTETIRSSSSTSQNNSGVSDETTGMWLERHDTIQIINAGDGQIDPPNNHRGVTGNDTMIATGEINYPGLGTTNGRFSIGLVPLSKNMVIYVRAWNGSTEADSTAYGNSLTFEVTASAIDFSYYDVGPGGGWGLGGTDNIAFYVGSLKPAPDGPTGLIGTPEGTTSLRWSWDSMSGVNTYEVFNNTGTLKIGETDPSTLNTLESGLTYGNHPYSRMVRALMSSGQTSTFSAPYMAYTLAATPTAISAKGGWNPSTNYFNMTVTWDADNAPGTNYYLHREGQSDLSPTTLFIGTDESVSLAGSTTYTFEVRAINGNGIYTEYSNKVTGVTPPSAPTVTASNTTTREITWSWTTPAGADSFKFYFAGATSPFYSGPNTIATTESLLPCRAYGASARGVSSIYGDGALGSRTKWTLPVIPSPVTGSTVYPRSVGLNYAADSNSSAVYEIQSSLSSNEGYITAESGTSSKTPTIVCVDANTLYWFKVRARNGEYIWSDFSSPISATSGNGATGGGTAPTITNVKFNNRTYIHGDVISAKPNLTAIITGEVDTSFKYVAVDPGGANEVLIPVEDITYEAAQGTGFPPGALILKAVFKEPIQAKPVNAHTIRIIVQNLQANQTTYNCEIAVMSGAVQVLGQVYNYPNPFRPMSVDPSNNATTISYSLNVDAPITVVIYDITGKEMNRYSYSKGEEGGRAGINSISWNGRSMFNQPVGNGMYVYKIISSNKAIGSGKLVVLD
jgi:hypothetical protein